MPFNPTKFIEKVRIEVDKLTADLKSKGLIDLNEKEDGIASTSEDYRKELFKTLASIIEHERQNAVKATPIIQNIKTNIMDLSTYRKPGN